jgi:hypothetical protein
MPGYKRERLVYKTKRTGTGKAFTMLEAAEPQ